MTDTEKEDEFLQQLTKDYLRDMLTELRSVEGKVSRVRAQSLLRSDTPSKEAVPCSDFPKLHNSDYRSRTKPGRNTGKG